MIQQAITTFFNSNDSGPLASTFTGGLFLLVAPPGELTKFCVMTDVAAPVSPAYGNAAVMDEPEIQFAAWDVTAASAMNLIQSLMTAFDTAELLLTDGRRARGTRLNSPLSMPGSGEKNANGGVVFGWQVTYRFAVSY